MDVQINLLAVLIGALLYFAGGALWYSSGLFGKSWMAANGFTEQMIQEMQKGAWKSYLTAFISALIISYGLARLEDYLNVTSFTGGLHAGFWAWFCFVVTTAATNNTFSNRPVKLLLIDSGYHLYGFLVIGVINAIWR